VPKMKKLALEAPEAEMRDSMKRSIKKTAGF